MSYNIWTSHSSRIYHYNSLMGFFLIVVFFLTSSCRATYGREATFREQTVRLIGKLGQAGGRLEVRHDGIWKNVCDDKFDKNAAQVVCRQLGLLNTSRLQEVDFYSNGNNTWFVNETDGTYWLDEVSCHGNESRLEDCGHEDWGETDCYVTEEVGVKCADAELRVRINKDFVETYYNGEWHGVCPTDYNNKFGNVVCHHLGYNESLFAQQVSPRVSKTPVLPIVFNCSGSEQRPVECPQYKRTETCPVSESLRMKCSIKSNHQHLLTSTSQLIATINLYGDALYQNKIQNITADMKTGDNIYVQVQSQMLAGIRMIVENCYAKPSHDADKSQSLILIQDGCEADGRTYITKYADSETRFFFAVNFDTGQRIVDVVCDVRSCKTASTTTCRQGCQVKQAS